MINLLLTWVPSDKLPQLCLKITGEIPDIRSAQSDFRVILECSQSVPECSQNVPE